MADSQMADSQISDVVVNLIDDLIKLKGVKIGIDQTAHIMNVFTDPPRYKLPKRLNENELNGILNVIPNGYGRIIAWDVIKKYYHPEDLSVMFERHVPDE